MLFLVTRGVKAIQNPQGKIEGVISLASQLRKAQVTALTAGSIEASGGWVIGYGLGQRRNG